MVKVNPRAYLSRLRNVRRGVVTRSRIIESMGAGATVPQICFRSGLSPSNVRYHLTNMMAEGLVLKRRSRGRTWWMMTGAGQKTIDEVT
ncbi:MAG: winged helix-turn-helix domain-containing protein [Nitrososphaerota archaeon]